MGHKTNYTKWHPVTQSMVSKDNESKFENNNRKIYSEDPKYLQTKHGSK